MFAQCNGNAAPGNMQNCEIEPHGAKETLCIHGNRWEIEPERINRSRKPVLKPSSAQESQNTAFQARNSRAQSTVAHKTKSYLYLGWDGKAERSTNHEAANRYLRYRYRPLYRLNP
jgi:hypothetical protein